MESIGILIFLSLIMTSHYFHDVVDCNDERDLRLSYNYSSGNAVDRLRQVHVIQNIVIM